MTFKYYVAFVHSYEKLFPFCFSPLCILNYQTYPPQPYLCNKQLNFSFTFLPCANMSQAHTCTYTNMHSRTSHDCPVSSIFNAIPTISVVHTHISKEKAHPNL